MMRDEVRAMQFGVWDHFENRPGIAAAVQYQEKIGLVRQAERLGYSFYHVAEHHLSPLDLAPSPAVFLAALAQATSRIRVGTGVFCLPLYHPVRLVQEICMLDNISDGRLDVGVGRGIRAGEHEWFGVPQSEVRPRFEEMLSIVTGSLTKGRLGFEGAHYRLADVPLDLMPVQRPYPPMWYAGGFETAGRRGFCFLTRIAEQLQRYWEFSDASKGEPGRVNAHLASPMAGITRHIVIRRTYEEAEAIARRSWPTFEAHWFATPIAFSEDGRAVMPRRGPADDFDQALRDDRRLLIGTPESVGERLAGWADEFKDRPGFFFAPAVQWGDISTAEAIESLELMASEVMPSLRETVAS